MKRFKKLVLTAAALAALAVGGAAFAQAQNAGTVTKSQVQTRSVETGTRGDPADAPGVTDREQADGNEAADQESGPEKGEKADAPGEKESPDSPDDQRGPDDQGGQSD
jgi:hypothetical protein